MIAERRFMRAIGISILTGAILAVTQAQASPTSSKRSSSSRSEQSSSPQQCDLDRDGALASSPACGGQDCNDSDAEINPKRLEISISACQDGKDNDCNGATDCADRSCEGKPAFLPNSVKPTGMCCSNLGGGNVVDVSKDSENCGSCGRQCKDAEICVDGQCVSECTASTTTCFREPFPFQTPIKRSFDGKYPQPIQSILDRYLGNPDCPRPTTEPRFDLKYFSEPLLDGRGKPTDQTVRGLCVTAKF